MDEQPLANETEAGLIAAGYRKYRGEAIDIYYNKEICTHTGNCVRGNPAIFEVGRRPWVIPDNGEAAQAAQVIHTCPSGALKYVLKEEQSWKS
ncbi:(4Fe-4S)-binding protein [Enterococcus innesii]|uniref:(4Fe-4S)-binding protein n=1 Tax=Enterococcus innesii TaxID=2839759 RepID=UPI0034A2EF8F